MREGIAQYSFARAQCVRANTSHVQSCYDIEQMIKEGDMDPEGEVEGIFLTDGCAKQYKSRYVLQLLSRLRKAVFEGESSSLPDILHCVPSAQCVVVGTDSSTHTIHTGSTASARRTYTLILHVTAHGRCWIDGMNAHFKRLILEDALRLVSMIDQTEDFAEQCAGVINAKAGKAGAGMNKKRENKTLAQEAFVWKSLVDMWSYLALKMDGKAYAMDKKDLKTTDGTKIEIRKHYCFRADKRDGDIMDYELTCQTKVCMNHRMLRDQSSN